MNGMALTLVIKDDSKDSETAKSKTKGTTSLQQASE